MGPSSSVPPYGMVQTVVLTMRGSWGYALLQNLTYLIWLHFWSGLVFFIAWKRLGQGVLVVVQGMNMFWGRDLS